MSYILIIFFLYRFSLFILNLCLLFNFLSKIYFIDNLFLLLKKKDNLFPNITYSNFRYD